MAHRGGIDALAGHWRTRASGARPSRGGQATLSVGELHTGPLTVVPAELLDGLPFGVIRLTGDGLIEAYNDTEARLARRSAAYGGHGT